VGYFFSFTQRIVWVNVWSYLARFGARGFLDVHHRNKPMNTIVLVVVLAALLTSFLAGFIVSYAKTLAAVELPAPVVILPPRLNSANDPGRILKRSLCQTQNSHLAAWFQGMRDCDKLHFQRKGSFVWGQPNMYHTAIHHPIMRWDLVKNTTGVTRGEMGAWYVKQAQY
jgi:hypothetical protein